VRTVARTTSLGKWIRRQRQIFQRQNNIAGNFKKGEDSQLLPEVLSDEQIKSLKELDTDWWMTNRLWQWETRYRELTDYAKAHKDCCVPISHSNKQLAHFVSNQRKQYNLKKQGRPSNLTDYRMKRLEAIGFVWNRWEYEFSKKEKLWEASRSGLVTHTV
jgi:hypothetical protein